MAQKNDGAKIAIDVIGFILHLLLLPLILFTAMTLQKLKEAGEALAAGNLAYHTDTEKM